MYAQTPSWNLKFSSTVEKDGKTLSGASIQLLQGSAKVAETTSAGNGDFELSIPPNGDYMVVVSYNGCNTKKFQVSTRGVPESMTKDNFKAEIKVAGVTMSKPLPTIDYSLLNQPMLQIIYLEEKKKFSDDPSRTNQMLAGLQKIRDDEAALIARYEAANKAGDIALKKKECDIAKQNYENAHNILPDEDYPKKQLELVIGCANEKLAEQNKAKEEELAKQKLIEENALIEKQKAEQLAIALKAKEEADKIAKEKAVQDKIANEKLKAEQLATQIKAKEESDKLAKEKSAQDKIAADKLKQEKLAADKLKAEKIAEEAKAKQEAAKLKTEQTKLAAEKAKNDKLEAEKKAKEEALAKQAKNTATTTAVIEPKETNSTTSEPKEKTEAKHSVPQAFGVDKYKEVMVRANEFLKMKRYDEAKTAYNEALTLKPNDAIAKAKLVEVEKLIQAKTTKP